MGLKRLLMGFLVLGASAIPLGLADIEPSHHKADMSCTWNDDVGDVSCDCMSVYLKNDGAIIIKGSSFTVKAKLDCSDTWTSISDPKLSNPVWIRGGNACAKAGKSDYKGAIVWVKKQRLEVTKDKHCRRTGKGDKDYRCIVIDE